VSARLAAVLVSLIVATAADAAAQLQVATIEGMVRGPDNAPVSGAVVTLLDGLGDSLTSVPTAPDGRFRLTNLAPGIYAIRADAPPLSGTVRGLAVGGALPVDVNVRLSAVAAEQVVVRGNGEVQPGSTATRVTLAGDAVRRAPARIRSRGLQDAIATVPGWSTEDNGLLHVRGVDDGFLYVIDGVPVYERLDGLFGIAPDPALIDSVTVSTGYIPPEFGLKSGGVIQVRSAERTSDRWAAAVDLAAGSDAAADVSAVTGGAIGTATALTLGIARQRSDRFLDPVHPGNLHNSGTALSGGAQAAWRLSSAGSLTAVAGFGRSDFDVPHGQEQETAGQDQRQRVNQLWQTVSWQRVWSADAVSQVAGYHRFGASTLTGTSFDTPLYAEADRDLRRVGALGSLTVNLGGHLLKVGGEAAALRLREHFVMAVTDEEAADEADFSEEVIAFTPEAPFALDDRARPSLISFYVQDSVRPIDRLTIDLGIRADWSRLLDAASQWSPRIGAAYRWPRSETTLRASFGRFFQPPQPENLLLASSEAARALSPFVGESGGGSQLEPERQTAVEVGIEQRVGTAARVDAAYWYRRITNAADPNVLLGTTLVFPNSVARGRASGLDLRVEVPRRAGWSGYVSYANSRVEQFGPITGGLFLEEEIAEIGPGTRFVPDHDQRHVGAFGVTFAQVSRGLHAALTGRYESGTPVEAGDDDLDELQELPGAEMVDFERGRVRPRTVLDLAFGARVIHGAVLDVDLRLSVLNLSGARWAYNFGNPFSGTHFGPGRTVQAGLRLALR
jgi:outer membrane cobalamin receptor